MTLADRVPAPSARAAAATWGALLGAAAALLLLARWSERLPAPRPADAAATEFSAARAWPVVAQLADSIGLRVAGTPGAERALAYLEARLRAIPALEVQVQDITGVVQGRRRPVWYRTRNLVARLPGAAPEAVLLSAHYDSPPESVGAADDAVGTAAVVEVLRALAAGPRPAHTVVANINGAEEQGLLGAAGFLQHPWARDVRAFLDLESAGTHGKAILFQGGPGNAWLTRAYARGAPHPYGSVIAQDIFQSGAIPSSTDFEVYADAGLRGLDLALYRNGYAYHTALDRSWNVSPGSLQHMGDNALGVTRALLEGPLPGDIGGRGGIYYDLLGITMVAYAARTAGVLAVLAAVLALAATILAARRLALPVSAILGGLIAALAAALVGVVVPAMAAALPPMLGRPHGWFAHPTLGVFAYAPLALAALCGVHAVWARLGARHGGERRAAATWAGGLLLWTLALLALTLRGVGSAYLLLWWVVPGAVGLSVLAATGGRGWALAAAVGFVPGTLPALQVAHQLIGTFVPIAGRMLLPIPFDPVIAALVAASVVLIATLPLSIAHRVGRFGTASLTMLAAGLAGLVATMLTFPYTPRRPQRLAVMHESTADSARMLVAGFDWLGPRMAVRQAGLAPRDTSDEGRGAVTLAASPAPHEPPAVRLLGERVSGDSVRSIDVRIHAAGAYAIVLSGAHRARFVAVPDTGWTLTLHARRGSSVELTATAYRAEATAAADSVIRRLPPWTTAYALSLSSATYRF